MPLTIGKAIAGNGRLADGRTLAEVKPEYANPLTDYVNLVIAETKANQSLEQQKIVAERGFEVCEFEPDSDPCEACRRPNLQLYFQGPTDAGRYLCLNCILEEHAQNQCDLAAIERLEQEGHTNHCGSRQVWGDGECECQKAGIVPGPVSRMVLESV